MMWVEILVGLTLGTMASLGIAFPVVAPEEYKRFTNAIRAHIPASIAKRRSRWLSIEMAAELSVDVDMKWWDDQFAKLMPSAKHAVEAWNRGGTYNRPPYLYPNNPPPHLNQRIVRMEEFHKLVADFHRWEPAMPEWQRIKLSRDIASADTADRVHVAWAAARAALSAQKRLREGVDCGDCEYVEQATYANGTARRVTGFCSRCAVGQMRKLSDASMTRSLTAAGYQYAVNSWSAGLTSDAEIREIAEAHIRS